MPQAYAALVALDLRMGGRAIWSPENPGKEDSYSYRRGGGGGEVERFRTLIMFQ